MIFLERAAIKTLPAENKFISRINENGHANWYKIGDESAEQEITVDIPENAAFAVYNSQGNLVNYSLITKSNNRY